ncbi:MAG: hypothetical protein IPI72_09870 [Flavobacteriales bacterium]|nr:hypothetical protein [Flavobacteriales bacterium]
MCRPARCGVLGLRFVEGTLLFLMRQTIIVVSRLIEFDLKNRIYTHHQQLDRGFYKRNSTGDLMNRISEDVGKCACICPAVMYTINLMVLFVMCIGFMLNGTWNSPFGPWAPLPIMSLIIYRVSDVMNRRSMAVQKQQSRLSTLAQESFSGIRVLSPTRRGPWLLSVSLKQRPITASAAWIKRRWTRLHALYHAVDRPEHGGHYFRWR